MDGRWTKRSRGAEHELLVKEGVSKVARRMVPAEAVAIDPAIYLLRTVGADFVKVGTLLRVRALQHRLELIQTGCPFPVRLVLVVIGAGRQEEVRLHETFAPLRAHGEWFRIEGAMAAILQLAASDPDAAIALLWSEILC